jgi:hypothetical protein
MTAHGSRAEFMGVSGALFASAVEASFVYRLLTAVVIAVVSTLIAKLVEKWFK